MCTGTPVHNEQTVRPRVHRCTMSKQSRSEWAAPALEEAAVAVQDPLNPRP